MSRQQQLGVSEGALIIRAMTEYNGIHKVEEQMFLLWRVKSDLMVHSVKGCTDI